MKRITLSMPMALAISASIFGKDITGRIHDEPLPLVTHCQFPLQL